VEGGVEEEPRTKFEFVVEGTKLDNITKFEGIELTKILVGGLEVIFTPVELLLSTSSVSSTSFRLI
jgi:hypothetical protein